MIEFKPIGYIHSPFKNPGDIQRERNTRSGGFDEIRGEIELLKEYEPGLADIDGFSHLIILFHFHRASDSRLTAHPPFDNKERGVFATRSPHRPNPLGMSIVRFLGRRENRLSVAGLDMIEGTPVLDIKPYTARDRRDGIRLGWLEPHQGTRE
jgi:tRNA-Thr(GGU) m(6)t(6)A37 methyltransferase TsaA